MDAGRVVGVDRLVDGQYGEEPPAGAANAVQAQVSRLRRALGGDVVEFGPGGYRLVADPDDVDALRFTRLAADGRRLLGAGRPAEAAGQLRRALDLWRGEPLADLPGTSPATPVAIARLTELRLTAAEDLAVAELALPGGPSIAELQRLAAVHPLRERLRGLHVRALHAAGRTAEALAEYDRVRRLLRAELGADPSPELAAIHATLPGRPGPGPLREHPGELRVRVRRRDHLADRDRGRRARDVREGGTALVRSGGRGRRDPLGGAQARVRARGGLRQLLRLLLRAGRSGRHRRAGDVQRARPHGGDRWAEGTGVLRVRLPGAHLRPLRRRAAEAGAARRLRGRPVAGAGAAGPAARRGVGVRGLDQPGVDRPVLDRADRAPR